MQEITINSIVKATYNSGTYIGKVIEDRGNFWLVEVLAVLKHPDQGDLHKPGQVEGVAFHERKALAYREKMNARKRHVTIYDGPVPEYRASLKTAVEEFKAQLAAEDTAFNRRSLARLTDLEKYFYDKIFNQKKKKLEE